MKKYEFTGKEKKVSGKTLKQIVCVTAFASISVGDIGGWIESEKNLDHSGNAWVSGDAMVYGRAWVSGDAMVYGDARVYGDSRVYGRAWVYGDAMVYGRAWVSGDARVYGDSRVYGDAIVYGDARVYGDSRVYGRAWVSGISRVSGDAIVYGDARVSGDAEVLTKKAITINSNYHHVTITDTHITIGCQNKTKEFWKDATFETIEEIDGEESAKSFIEFKPFIMKLAEID